MNWGWSGDDDGYYSPTDLAPNRYGYDFSDTLVGAIIGIEPPGGLGIAQISTNQTITVYPNPGSGVYNIALENVSAALNLQFTMCLDNKFIIQNNNLSNNNKY